MFRKAVAGPKQESKDLIRWRGHEVTRIEAFSDAVFAFAITLLVISLEVPKDLDDLLNKMYGFIPFACCFFMLFQIWMTQNKFFRRYGIHDEYTIVLNGILMFLVIFFGYPLKFLWVAITNNYFLSVTYTKVMYLFFIYSGGFTLIFTVFALMYYHALKKPSLQLTESEKYETRTYLYRQLGMAAIGLLSIILASSPHTINFAGVVYALIGPLLGILHSRRGKIHRTRFKEEYEANIILNNDPDGHHK